MRNARMTIWVMLIVLSLATLPLMATVEFKDGQIHNITTTINDDVYVDYCQPGLETTVNLLDGGHILATGFYGDVLRAFEDSQINIFGGEIDELLRASDNSKVTVSGGKIEDLRAEHNSQITVSGGNIEDNLYAYDNSKVDVSGGSMDCLGAFEDSQINLSGGTVHDDLIVRQSGVLTIDGSDFSVTVPSLMLYFYPWSSDGQLSGYGEVTNFFPDGLQYVLGGETYEPYRHLTGTLANGDPLDTNIYLSGDAKIVLIPEPATLLLLGLGAVMLSRRG